MSFKDKVVLITGASSGIGAATAVLFAREAANVALIGRNEGRLNGVAEKCKQLGAKTLSIKADITNDEKVKNMIAKTIERFGKLDILINNAGILRKADIVEENYIESYDLVMSTNIRAVVLTTNLAAPHIIKTKGNIVNISSISGKVAIHEHFSAYKASAAAIDHFSRCIALELAPHGVRVNTVSPGLVETNIFDTAGLPGVLDNFNMAPLGKHAEPEEISNLILYLASDKASSITGSNYDIDNGYHLK